MMPPSGATAAWREPASRQTNSPGPTSCPDARHANAGPALALRHPWRNSFITGDFRRFLRSVVANGGPEGKPRIPGEMDPGILRDFGHENIQHRTAHRLSIDGREICFR